MRRQDYLQRTCRMLAGSICDMLGPSDYGDRAMLDVDGRQKKPSHKGLFYHEWRHDQILFLHTKFQDAAPAVGVVGEAG